MTNMLTEDSVALKKKHMYMLTFHRQVVDLPIIGDLACFFGYCACLFSEARSLPLVDFFC